MCQVQTQDILAPMQEEIFDINDTVKIFYSYLTDGAGRQFTKEFEDILQKNFTGRTFKNCLEWCAGPGFIGTSLWANNVCKNLDFLEKFDPAITQLHKTREHNNANFDIYRADCISAIPPDKKYDLIVGNPPWFPDTTSCLSMLPPENFNVITERICIDELWQSHKNFFNHVSDYLTDDGVILLVEHTLGSPGRDSEFMPMLENNDLTITGVFDSQTPNKNVYYLVIERTNDSRSSVSHLAED